MTTRLRAIVREAAASAIAQRGASLLIVAIVAGMCAAVLLTAGRAAGAQRAVLDAFDAAGTRMIVVHAESAAGLHPTVLDRLTGLDDIAWAGAFGPAEDVVNAGVPGGTRTPMRPVWTRAPDALGLPPTADADPVPGVWASPAALERLGMPDAAGAVRTVDGLELGVRGRIAAPGPAAFLEPLVLEPRAPDAPGRVAVLVVVATRPALVGPLTPVVLGLLAPDDPTAVRVTTSEQLAALRAAVEARLGAAGSTTVLGIVALTAALVAVVLRTLVALRRKDFGRRRALGATRSIIVALLLAQVGLLAATGAVLGTAGALAVLAWGGEPVPGAAYVSAVALLAMGAALAAATAPAIVASRREPIVELRVP